MTDNGRSGYSARWQPRGESDQELVDRSRRLQRRLTCSNRLRVRMELCALLMQLLERAAHAMTCLAELENTGRLDKIMTALK